MRDFLFDNWRSWRVCFLSGCRKTGWGLGRIVTCIILGLLSVVRWLWRLLRGAVGDNPTAAVIVAVVLCVLVYVSGTVTVRSRLVAAEYQRDSLSYELSKFTQMYDSTATIIINGDTIRHGKVVYSEGR